MNERIQALRNNLRLSQEAFGRRLGISRSAVSNMESGRYNVTDTLIKLMCQNFNVNDEWLRTGEGVMFEEHDETAITALVREYKLDTLSEDILRTYVRLPTESRKVANHYIRYLADQSKNADLNEIAGELHPDIDKSDKADLDRERERAKAIIDAQAEIDEKYNRGGGSAKSSS